MSKVLAVTVYTASSFCLHAGHCWVHYDNMNAVAGLLPSPRADDRPTTFYFSEVDNRQACVSACDEVVECFAYTWIDPDLASSYAGQCYGVNQQSATHVEQQAGHHSGKKTDCGC